MQVTERRDTECVDIPWNCQRCSALLGYAMTIEDITEMRIKVKDSYIYVTEPEVLRVTCRKCSFENVVRKLADEGSTE